MEPAISFSSTVISFIAAEIIRAPRSGSPCASTTHPRAQTTGRSISSEHRRSTTGCLLSGALKDLSPQADLFRMTRLKVVEWKKYGHHRLYLKTQSGEDVGWIDLMSSRFELLREDLRSEFELALRSKPPHMC